MSWYEDSVHPALMTPGQGSELPRQGECHHEILDRQQFGALSVQPLTGLMVLALRTTSVPTGARLSPIQITARAMPMDMAGIGGAATLDGADGPAVAGQESIPVTGFQLRQIAFEQSGERHGDILPRPTCSRLTSAFILAAESWSVI